MPNYKYMKNKIVGSVVLAACIAGGLYGYKQHERNSLISLISPSIKNASIRVSNAARLQTEKSSMTFKELFDRMDADIAEVDKRSIEVQSLATSDNSSVTGPAVAYLHDCEEFSRAFSMKFRKGFAFSNSMEHVQNLIDEPMPTSSYGWDDRKNRREAGIKDMNAAAEAAKAAASDLISATKKLKDSRTKIVGMFTDDALVDNKQLDALIKANELELKPAESKKPAQKG